MGKTWHTLRAFYLPLTVCSKHTRLPDGHFLSLGYPIVQRRLKLDIWRLGHVGEGKTKQLQTQKNSCQKSFFLCSVDNRMMAENKEGPSFCDSPSFCPLKQDGQKLRLVSAGSPTPPWLCTSSDLHIAKISWAGDLFATDGEQSSRLDPSSAISTWHHGHRGTAAEIWFSSAQCKMRPEKEIS